VEHDAANDIAAPLSDDDFHRLFNGDSSTEPDSSVIEDGFSFDILDSGDLSAFPFDSMVNFDSEPVALEGIEPAHGLPNETSYQTSSLQPSLGASTSRCDGQGIAAGC
jgi:transcriptional activator HAC1